MKSVTIYIYIGWLLMNLTRSRLRASPRPAREFCRWLSMLITFGIKGSSYLCSQITGGVEIAVSLHADIPYTGERGFELPSEDSLQEYLKFPYECFLSVLPFEGYCYKLCPSNNPRRKNHTDHFSVSTRGLCFVFLSVKSPVVLSLFTKSWIVCLLGTLSSWNFRRHFPADFI
jgi:hypothetical protein